MSYWSFLISFGVTLGVCASIYILLAILKRRKDKKNKLPKEDNKEDQKGYFMVAVLQEFVSILVGAVTDLGTGIAQGISNMAQALFLEIDGTTHAVSGLSVFGGIVAIFAGLGLAVGITTKIYLWITSLGSN